MKKQVIDSAYAHCQQICRNASTTFFSSFSALEIENKLLDHPAIAEVAVLGIEDRTWGEAVAAVVVLKSGGELTLAALKDWCDGKLSAYKIPKKLLLQDSLPRNAMGKVTKPALKAHF